MHDVLKGRVGLVTGAAQGNGRAIALGLARHGAAVALGDLNDDGTKDVAAECRALGSDVYAAPLDVRDPAACRRFAADAETALGPVSILVNNAGIIRRVSIDDPSFTEDWDAVFRVNVDGTRNMTLAVLDQLRRTIGCVINIGSIMSYRAAARGIAYSASKGAIMQITKALALELASDGIRVNALAPGVIATPMTESTRADETAIGKFLSHTPMGRVGEPDELVGPVVFLASPMSSYVTGVVLPVDGGYLTI